MITLPHSRRNRDQGFTLIEILVVITLIGIIIGTATYAFGGLGQRRLHQEAHRLAAELNHLADRALMTQTDLRWVYHRESGSCEVRTLDSHGEWQVDRNSPSLGCHFKAIRQISFPPTDVLADDTAPWSRTQTDAESEAELDSETTDSLWFFATGEYPPLSLVLNADTKDTLTLQGDGLNPIQVVTAAP